MPVQLIALAEELGLKVTWRDGAKRGGFHAGTQTIRLSPGASERTTRSVLAHEIGHAVYQDSYAPPGPTRDRQEARANEWAARHLITPDAYAAAEQRRGIHAASLAYELGVTIELVEAYQRLLERIGDTVYVAPRMGAGLWDHRVKVS